MANTLNLLLARHIIARAEALGYKGKRRDAFALDAYAAAITVLREAGKASEAASLEVIACLLVASRGFDAVLQMIEGKE